MQNTITVHPLSNEPTAAWAQLSKFQNSSKLSIKNSRKPAKPDHVRIVCMSDTHSQNENFTFKVPDGDVFIHAGDFTMWGREAEVIEFNEWMKSLPHKHKIVISGNHELTFDEDCDLYKGLLKASGCSTKKLKTHLQDCTYLEDSAVTLHGLKIYGSPWQPEHGGLAFNLPRGDKLLSKWNLIPDDVDILITHGPPVGYGDKLYNSPSGIGRAGCVELLSTIQKRVKPRYHICGHIHEGYGISTDGTTTFINASTCNHNYVPLNVPIVIDIPLKSSSNSPSTSCSSGGCF